MDEDDWIDEFTPTKKALRRSIRWQNRQIRDEKGFVAELKHRWFWFWHGTLRRPIRGGRSR